MSRKRRKKPYTAIFCSAAIILVIVALGALLIPDKSMPALLARSGWPLARIMLLIAAGLAAGTLIEELGWTRPLGALTAPLLRLGGMSSPCSAVFTTSFVSGVSANAMLANFYRDGKISRPQLVLVNLLNQLPSYFRHFPTTACIAIPLTGTAGAAYLLCTLSAALLRSALYLAVGRLIISAPALESADSDAAAPLDTGKRKHLLRLMLKSIPGRTLRIAAFVIPIYLFVTILNAAGAFSGATSLLAAYVSDTMVPLEALSMVVVSFAAEMASGFTAAGMLCREGTITMPQAVLALLLGNILSSPLRALRHQLPRYIGIFTPRIGFTLIVLGQGCRVASLIIVGALFYLIF